MSALAIVSAEVDEELKDQASAIYAEAGFTISEAFRMLLVRTVAERALPFDSFNPNAETIEAMMQGRQRQSIAVGSIEDLMADLHEDD